ncbi:MAG: NTP transferase domain-containing protein [Candidatus Kaiserbacteria bacterium]|nr:NTP transferase domain-containing protein [Candidatus Kaiserbacteria bacterium]
MIQPIILAAGKGTRLRATSPKALFHFMGKPLIQWVIDAVKSSRVTKEPIIVVGHQSDAVRAELGPSYTYIEQIDISGTASAVKVCLPSLSTDDVALVLYSDQPLVQASSIERIEQAQSANPDALVMGAVRVPNYDGWFEPFSKYGRIIRNGQGAVKDIVEFKDATEAELKILEVNPSVFCVDVKWLATAIERIIPSAVTNEYYLTDIVKLAAADGKRIITVDLTPAETVGINSPEDAEKAAALYATPSAHSTVR